MMVIMKKTYIILIYILEITLDISLLNKSNNEKEKQKPKINLVFF
jgi:hypothetical protein